MKGTIEKISWTIQVPQSIDVKCEDGVVYKLLCKTQMISTLSPWLFMHKRYYFFFTQFYHYVKLCQIR